MFGKIAARGVLVGAILALAVAAQADTVNLATGWNVTWNISNSPSASPTQDIQIQDPNEDDIFNGYDLGLYFVRTSGTGTIAVSSAANPSSAQSIIGNAAWLNSTPELTPTGLPPTAVGGAIGSEYLLDNVANLDQNYTIPSTLSSLLTLGFGPGTSAPTIGSVFKVYADASNCDYVDASGNTYTYANNSSDLYLGTITVTGVPEPSSLVLLGAAGVGFVVLCVRRKIRRCRESLAA